MFAKKCFGDARKRYAAVRTRRWLTAATATTVSILGLPTQMASAVPSEPANASAPYSVEDGAYPGAADVLEMTGATLVQGDGGITHTSCEGPFQIKIWARDIKLSENQMCFAAPRATGYLAVSIPQAYRIRATGRDLQAKISIEDQERVLSIPKDTTKGFGEAGANSSEAVLLELRVTGSSVAPPADQPNDTGLAFTGKITVGDNKRFCTAVLVDPRWVVTAKSCFADKPSESIAVPAGAPKNKTTLIIGRNDLSSPGVRSSEIVELVPREDRDVVMARLSQPMFDVTPAAVSSGAPTPGEELTTVGFGRTSTEWAPTKVHTTGFRVGSTAATGFDLAPKPISDGYLCKGDAGAPAVRTENGKPTVVAINSRSLHGNCLDSSQVTAGGYDARLDDLRPWIDGLRSRRSAAANEAGGSERIRWADFDGDGKPDYINIADNGEVSVWLNRGGDGAGGWTGLGQVAVGTTTDRSRVRLADFDGDGKFDYLVINPDGTVKAWLNRGGDKVAPWQEIGQVATGVTADVSKVRFADWDGDGRTDYIVFNDANNFEVYLNRGGDSVAPWQGIGKVTTATNDRARVRFADSDGDGKADYYVVKANGGVDLYLNRGGDVVANGWQWVGQITTGATTDHTKVQFVDFTADTHADYVLADKDTAGSATVYRWNGGDTSGPNGWTNIGKVAYGGV
ncbi:FG-GAP-like repeat-containing protein [Streptomyces goshikiensis]|uniref:FG-GAP-like repeat-containing protein n=1 Tax=Streptomyces goshikiensis TaxID=1942 RepID=UPI00365A51BF